MKVSELGTTVGEIKTTVNKVFGEQQTKYDALKAKYDELVTQLEDAEVPAAAQASIDELKNLLKAMDDSIPDTEPTPA